MNERFTDSKKTGDGRRAQSITVGEYEMTEAAQGHGAAFLFFGEGAAKSLLLRIRILGIQQKYVNTGKGGVKLRQQVCMPNGRCIFDESNPKCLYDEQTLRQMIANGYRVRIDGKAWSGRSGKTVKHGLTESSKGV